MKRRIWKIAGLAAAGGVLLQFGGCAGSIVNILISNLAPLLLSQLVSAILGNVQNTAA